MDGRQLVINRVQVGDGWPCYITFEAGPTHEGMESAKALVREAAKSGANAIKFQIFDADKLIEDKDQLFRYTYLANRLTGELREIEEPLYNILKRRQLSEIEWTEVKREADRYNLAFFATVAFEEDIELMRAIQAHSIKIASADINHYPLLRMAAATGMNIQIDTGNSSIDEISESVRVLEEAGCTSIIIHQCPSGYPARLPSINLRMIKSLRERFPRYPIAYSDHTPDADMDIAAVALGVNMVEKTVTFDKTTKSVEHVFSLEPHEMSGFVERIRDVEIALGDEFRRVDGQQLEARRKLRRGAYLRKSVSAGDDLTEDLFNFKRPCSGLPIDELDSCIRLGAKFKRSLDTGYCLKEGDILVDEGK